MRRICKYCGREYDGDPGGSCCPDCAADRRESTIRDRICRRCGASFPGGPRAWYCPSCRKERAREAQARYRRKGPARRLGSLDICVRCGREYTVEGSRQRYCPSCAPEAVREVDRGQSLDWKHQNTTPDARREERKKAAAEIRCAVCGAAFVPTNGALTCSPACGAQLRRRSRQTWETSHKEERSRYRKARRKEAERRMSPEEYRAYREAINAKAREAYRKRKRS